MDRSRKVYIIVSSAAREGIRALGCNALCFVETRKGDGEQTINHNLSSTPSPFFFLIQHVYTGRRPLLEDPRVLRAWEQHQVPAGAGGSDRHG